MDGSYFRRNALIGPAFGASKKDAATFDDGWLAYNTIKRFPMMVLADLVNERGVPCDVSGKALRSAAKKPAKAKGKG
jgi:hypothetical protein